VSRKIKPPSKNDREVAFGALIERLKGWEIPEEAMDRVHDAARASLNEVKALTEYEDGKVSRLLTVVAFLSAVVAAVFTRRFASAMPIVSTAIVPTKFCQMMRRVRLAIATVSAKRTKSLPSSTTSALLARHIGS
jgi:hypothetical protein